jgi:hypothetical protein
MRDERMNHSQSSSRLPVKLRPSRLWLAVAICAGMVLPAGNASAQLAPNQTNGFGNGGLVTFTSLLTFDCVDQPTMDLDFNGIMAQSDPNEMQTPICQAVTEPAQHPPAGASIIPHTFTCWCRCSGKIQTLNMRWNARTEDDPTNSAASSWGTR